MSRMENAKNGIIFGLLNNIVGLVLPFISRTVVIYFLGTEYAGLGGLFTSIISVLSISELGFGMAVSYLLYEPMIQNETEKVCAILNFSRKCFLVIGIIVLTIGLGIIPVLSKLISQGYPDNINIYVLYIIYLLNSVVSYFAYSYKRILFAASQRYDLEAKINTLCLFLQYSFQIIIICIWKNYYWNTIVMLLCTILNNILCGYMTRKMYPEYVCKGKIAEKEKHIIRKQVEGAFFSKIGSIVYLSADNIVVSAFFGLLILGQYGNYYYIISALFALFAAVHNTLRPIYGNCIITESKEYNFRKYKQFNYGYLWISGLCACCMLVLYQNFIAVWVGEQNTFSYDMVLLFVIYFIVGRVSCVPTLFAESAGLWWESRYISLFAALLNLILNIIMSNLMGIQGVLLSSIISGFLITQVGYSYVLFKKYFQDREQFLEYVKDTIIILIEEFVILALVKYLLGHIEVGSWLSLIGKGIITVLAFYMLFIILNFRNRLFLDLWRKFGKKIVRKR